MNPTRYKPAEYRWTRSVIALYLKHLDHIESWISQLIVHHGFATQFWLSRISFWFIFDSKSETLSNHNLGHKRNILPYRMLKQYNKFFKLMSFRQLKTIFTCRHQQCQINYPKQRYYYLQRKTGKTTHCRRLWTYIVTPQNQLRKLHNPQA